MTAKPNPIAHLVSTLQSEGEILVFLGAGSSSEGSQNDQPFPDFEMLISRVLQDEGIEVTENRMNDFLDVMKRWERESILSFRLASYLYGNPGISHLQLASVTMSLFPAVNMTMYMTTNFDDLMFKALSAVTKNSPQRDPKAFSLKKSAVISEITQIFHAIPRHTRNGTPVIVKLFGDLASNSPIFDSRDMPFDEFTEEKLVELVNRTTLFIGYGLRDAPVLRLLIRSGSSHPVFVVAPNNPIDDQIAQISQREFYWLPRTFSEFVSDLIETFSARNPSFETTLSRFLRDADIDLMVNSPWALRECARNASSPARSRYLNRKRGEAITQEVMANRTTRRLDTGPDLEAFKDSDARILGIIGESGSGKSTLLFQIYEQGKMDPHDLYVYYDSQSLQGAGSLAAKLALDFAVEISKLNAALRRIGSTLVRKGAQLFILIDALNESNSVDPLVIRYEIENLASEGPGNIRFIFSCRRVFWDARMNPVNDLPVKLYREGKIFLLSKFSTAEAKSAYELYRETFHLKTEYESLSRSLREHIRDPLMLRFISEAYCDSVLPQFAPAVLVFREIMDALRRRYRQTPLIDFLDCLIDQRLEHLLIEGDADDVFSYRAVRTDSNLALLAQQQMAGRFLAEHPLTILEDENIITPMESSSTRFKFTYERFHEFLIGLRLHYKIFSGRIAFLHFLETNLNRFRDAHYSFYQGLKSAFIIEYISTDNAQRRREIASLVKNSDRSVSTFGRDVMREVLFESDLDVIQTLQLLSDGESSATALFLDLCFESEGVLPYAIKGLLDTDLGIRRRSVKCLLFQARNFRSLGKMRSMILDLAKDRTIGKYEFARGLVYFFAVEFGAADEKSTAVPRMRELLVSIIERYHERLDFAGLANALSDVIELEGPLFFGANYQADGLFYPWNSRVDVERFVPAISAVLQDTSSETLKQHLDAVLFFSDIRVESNKTDHDSRLFGYQFEYRIVQWALIRTWMQDSDAALEMLDRIVERGQAFNIDFALGIVSHAISQPSATNLELIEKCRLKMSNWITQFEERFEEFYLSLKANDPFSFNLVPLAVLGSVEARFFTPESGVIPCISSWLTDRSLERRKMALLAANWLSQDYPVKVLTTLESALNDIELDKWYDRVLSRYEQHSPRLLEEFFDKMHFPTRRRTEIRALGMARDIQDVQYQCDSFLAWLFLEDQRRLRQLGVVYDMIYASGSLREFCLRLLHLWIMPNSVTVE
jgi:hypothetical protein